MTKRNIVWLCVVGALLAGLPACPSAEAATATWQNAPDTDLAGVNIYRAPGACATPGAFAKIDTVTKPATGPMPTSEVLPNPPADGKYCHRATSFDTANNESTVFSNTAEFEYNVVPPGAPSQLNVKP